MTSGETTSIKMNTEQPLMCSICNLDYTTWGQYEEHFWSMIHHKKLENEYGSGRMHMCSLCNTQTNCLSSYAKHLVSDVHRRALEERKKTKQLQMQHQRNLRMMGPRYNQHYQGGWMRGAWEQNQRKIWPRQLDRRYHSNSPQNWTWSSKNDFEAPPRKVIGPYSSPMNLLSQSSFSKSSASGSGGIKPGSCQTKTPCSVKQTCSVKQNAEAGSKKGTCESGLTKLANELKGHSSGVKSSSKPSNTKEKSLRTNSKATSKVIIKSKTDCASESVYVLKSSSYKTSSTLKSTRLSLSYKKSIQSRTTNCKSFGKGDQEKNGKKRNGSSESEKVLKYVNCEPRASTPAAGESAGVKKSVSGLKISSKSEDKQGREESSDRKKSTSTQEKTVETLVANASEYRTNTNDQSNVKKRGTELGTDCILTKNRRVDMSQRPVGIGKISAAGETRTPLEKTKKLLDWKEENVIKENLTSGGTSKTDLHRDEEHVGIQSAQIKASTTRVSSISETSRKDSDLNLVALPSSSVDRKSQSTLAVGKTPPEVTRLNLPHSNPELGKKDSLSGGIPSAASSEGPLESIELSGEASVTRVQLPPGLQRELTKLLVKSQGPRPRPNLAAARSRLHAGEHHQAQVVESPDRMVQQLLMKLLDSPKSRDRQVQQIEELQRLLVQASKKGSERARFGVQQLPEISLEVLESLLKNGQLKPMFTEDGIKSNQNQPITKHANELADSKEQLRGPFLVSSPLNQPHPARETQTVIKQEKVEPETHFKTEPPSPVPNKITIKTEPDLDSVVPTKVASSIQAVPSPPLAPRSTIQLAGARGTDKIIQITPQSINPKEVCNLPTEANTQQQPLIPEAQSHTRNSEPVQSNPQASSKKVSQKAPRKKKTSSLDLKDVLLQLSLKEERFHKRLMTVENSLRTTKELISKKQKHVKKLKEQKSKISQDVTAIRVKRLQLLKDATTSSLLSPASQKSLTKSCRKKCQKLTSQASHRRSSTPVSSTLLSSLTAISSLSCPVNKSFKSHATNVACTNPHPVTNNTPTLCKVSVRGSSIQGKSHGPAGRTLFQGPVSSTEVIFGAKPVSKLPQGIALGSSRQYPVSNPFNCQTTSTGASLSRVVNNPLKIRTPTSKISARESSNPDKSQGSAGRAIFQGPAGRLFFQGPAGQTWFQGPVLSTPVSVVSGSRQGSGPLSSSTTGPFLKLLANKPVKIHAEVTTAGSSQKSNTTSDSVDNPQQVKVKEEPYDPGCRDVGQAASVSLPRTSLWEHLKKIPSSFLGTSTSSDTLLETRVQGQSLMFLANNPSKIHAEITTAGSSEKRDTISDSVDKPQQVKVKVEPSGAGCRDVVGESLQAASISLPKTSLHTPQKVSSLFGTSASSDNRQESTVKGQSKDKKHIIGDISNTTSDSVDKSQQVKVKVEPSGAGCQDVGSDSLQAASVSLPKTSLHTPQKVSFLFGTSTSSDNRQESRVKGQSKDEKHIIGDISNTTSDSVDKSQQVKVKVEPSDPGCQDVGSDSLQAASVSLPESSLTPQNTSSLFGTSASSDNLQETRVKGQSKEKKHIIGDISNREQSNQDHQATSGTKRRLCQVESASPVSKRARTTEGLKEELAKAKSPRSKAMCRYPISSAVSSDTSTQEVPLTLKTSAQSASVCKKWMPVLKLRKIEHQDTTPVVNTERPPSVTTDEGKGSLTTLDLSVFEISSDSDDSASVKPATSRDTSSNRIYRKLSALRTHSPSPQTAHEQQSISEAKCGIFQAHFKAIHGMCNVKGRLCTVGADFTARVFNIEDFSCHKGFTGHHSSVNCAATWSNKDVDYLYTGSSDETVRVYNMQTFSCERVIYCNSRVMCLLLRWETLYAGLANGCVTAINLKDLTTKTLRCKTDILIECMITASYEGEACLIIGYADNTVGVHALGDGKQHLYLKGHSRPVLCLGVLDHHVYSGSVDRKVMIHDIKTGVRTKTIKHHGSAVTDLIVGTPYLITASLDKKVRLFNAQNGKLGRVIAECPYMISCMIRIKKMLYVGYTTGFVEAIDVKPDSTRYWSSRVKEKPKKKQVMFHCKWFDCGVLVKISNSTKHLNEYHIKRKKEHKCKWGSCDTVINKTLPNVQEQYNKMD